MMHTIWFRNSPRTIKNDISEWCLENFGPENTSDERLREKEIKGRWLFIGLGEYQGYGWFTIRDEADFLLFKLRWDSVIY